MKKPDVSSVTMRTANINMTNTMANQITNLTKNKYTRSLFNSEGVSKSSFSNSFNIDVRLSSSIKSNNSYGANPVIAIDITLPTHKSFCHSFMITISQIEVQIFMCCTTPSVASFHSSEKSFPQTINPGP